VKEVQASVDINIF